MCTWIIRSQDQRGLSTYKLMVSSPRKLGGGRPGGDAEGEDMDLTFM